MELAAAERLARHLMREHLDPADAGKFKWDNAKRRAGACHWTRDTWAKSTTFLSISLSRHIVILWDEAEVTDVILHEIAHRLAGHDASHGYTWQRIARSIGARPERCIAADAVMPELPYVATCPGCQKEHGLARLPKPGRNHSCSACSGGRYREEFRLAWAPRSRRVPGSAFTPAPTRAPAPMPVAALAANPAPVAPVEPLAWGEEYGASTAGELGFLF